MNDTLHFAHGGCVRETSIHELLDSYVDIHFGDYKSELGTRVVTETLSWNRFPSAFHFSAIFVSGFWADISAGRSESQAREFGNRALELWSNPHWRARGFSRLAIAQCWRQHRSERRERYLISAPSRWSDAQEAASGSLTPMQQLRLSFRPISQEEVGDRPLPEFLAACSTRALDDQHFDQLWPDALFYDTMQRLGEGAGGLLPNDKQLTIEPVIFGQAGPSFNESSCGPLSTFLSESSVAELIARADVDGLCALLRAQSFEEWDPAARSQLQALTRTLMSSRLFGCDLLKLAAAGAPMPARIATGEEALDWLSALAFNGWPPRAIQFLRHLCPSLPVPAQLPSEMGGEPTLAVADWAFEHGARLEQGHEYLAPPDAGPLDWALFCRAESSEDPQSLARLLALGANAFCSFTLNPELASAAGLPQEPQDHAARRLANRCIRQSSFPPHQRVLDCAVVMLRHLAGTPQWAEAQVLFGVYPDLTEAIAHIERELLHSAAQPSGLPTPGDSVNPSAPTAGEPGRENQHDTPFSPARKGGKRL